MKKILLLEDNLPLAQNIKALLESEGFDVFHVANSEDAFYIIENEIIDLILCDIMLPGIDGYEFLKIIREKLNINTPPFIFITAKSRRVDQRKCMELGADDFISKPFTIDELINAINVQLKKREILIEQSDNSNNSEILNYVEEKTLGTSKIKEQKLQYNGYLFIDEKDEQGYFPLNKLVYIKSMKDYTQLIFNNSKKILVRKTLTHWEKTLPIVYFVRIHRQTIINLEYLDRLEKDINYTYKVYLKTIEEPLKISQRYSRKLRKNL